MKILVATQLTQGQRKNDFCYVPEGEFVTFSSECDREQIDGRCGCRRSMVGLKNLKATTTIQVIDTHLTQKQFGEKLKIFLQKSGWARGVKDEEIEDWVKQDVASLLKIGAAFSVGTVLEKRGSTFRKRAIN